jgi:Na+/phosphate symporter
LILFLIFVINKTHYEHQNRVKQSEQTNIFNLEEVEDAPKAISTTFSHMGLLLKEVQRSLNITFDALFSRNLSDLGAERKKVRLIQNWINIIIANIFRTLRLLQKQEITISFRYAQAIRRLQKLSDGYRDIVARSYVHISNNHMGFSDRQVEELKQVKNLISEILEDMGKVFDQHETVNHDRISEKDNQLNELVRMLDQTQIDRIRRQTTKTRLNILYYAIIGDCKVISRQNIKLLNIFKESFSITQESGVSDTKA